MPKNRSANTVDSLSNRSLGFAPFQGPVRPKVVTAPPEAGTSGPAGFLDGNFSLLSKLMLDLTFSLLEGGLPQQGRVVVLFRFVTPARIVRSGMLNFDRAGRCFVGPQRNPELIGAALHFMESVEKDIGASVPVAAQA